MFLEAYRLAERDDHARAADLYERILELLPLHGESSYRLGEAYRDLGRIVDARDEWRALLSNPALDLPTRSSVNARLAEVCLLIGDASRSIGHAFLAKRFARFGAHALWNQESAPDDACEFELLSEAHCEMGEFAIASCCDAAIIQEIFARRDQLRSEYGQWLATVPQRTLYLSADWVRAIGHIALIDFLVKMQQLRWLDCDRIVLHSPPALTANRAYVRHYEPWMKVSADPVPSGASQHFAAVLGTRISSLLRIPGQPDRFFPEGMGVVQEEWERHGRAPLLRLSEEDREFGLDQLRAMGVPQDAWFAVLHVRSSAFHKEGDRSRHAHRNAEIASYLPSIQEIVRRGGWVIRTGDPDMPPLPSTPRAIDYAHGPFKSERMDVFLCASSRFFVGVASGLSHVPTTFGVPCLLTNWISNALPVYSRRDLFIPKAIWSDSEQRLLTFDEWLAPPIRARLILATEMAKGGLQAIDNTADDLRDAVLEMLDRLDGTFADDPMDENLQRSFQALACRHGLAGFPRIGRDFLRTHSTLLPAAAEMRKAG